MRARALLAALLGLLLSGLGCALLPRATLPPAPSQATPYAPDGADFVLVHHPAEGPVLSQVRQALDRALARTALWGPLEAPVVVHIHPDHARLEDALGLHDLPWLRAWARWDRVDLQSPASFGLFHRSRRTLEELVTHELTHCLMYQLQGDRADWPARHHDTPLWFREGMASWTAGQGHRRLSPRRVGAWMAESGADPLGRGEPLYRDHVKEVYGAAHHAFARLVAEHGTEAVRALLAAMRRGASFEDAFRTATGRTREAFEASARQAFLGSAPPATAPTPTTAAAAPAAAPRPGAAAGAPPR